MFDLCIVTILPFKAIALDWMDGPTGSIGIGASMPMIQRSIFCSILSEVYTILSIKSSGVALQAEELSAG